MHEIEIFVRAILHETEIFQRAKMHETEIFARAILHEIEIFQRVKLHETEILHSALYRNVLLREQHEAALIDFQDLRKFSDAVGGFGADMRDAAVADIHIIGVDDIYRSLIRGIAIQAGRRIYA